MIRRLAIAVSTLLVLWFAGCAQVSQVRSGDVTLKGRLTVTLDQPWNQFENMLGDATPTWTQDGITVDALKFYVGLKDGDLIAPTPAQPKGQKPLAFKSTMQASDVVSLFEGLYSRGGSSFVLEKVSPHPFIGQQGFRFEFSGIRKSDEVRMRGVGWGAVRDGELFVITYTAPRLVFFARNHASAEAIAKSARVSG